MKTANPLLKSGMACSTAVLLVLGGRASAATLQDFGYQNMNVNSRLAVGQRPLLVIVANFDGAAPLTNSAAYFDDLAFNTNRFPSINGYFQTMSNGRFHWTRGETIGPLNFPANQMMAAYADDKAYVSNIIYRAMSLFPTIFLNCDANHDSHITVDELGILVICNDSGGVCRSAGIVNYGFLFDWGGGTTHCNVGVINGDSPFHIFVEEFQETLGCWDIYGTDQNLSDRLTTQGNPNGPNDVYYLDPWHRMQLGWCDPRVQSLTAGGITTIAAAQMSDPSSPVVLYDPTAGTDEFFMLEYRTQTSPNGGGYDANVADNGLAIWHIHQNFDHSPTLVRGYNEGPPPAQENWRFCEKCKGIHFITDWHHAVLGPCPAGGQHDNPTKGPGYEIANNIASAPGEHGWLWCQKCQGLFHGPSPGHCPAGGAHDGSLSGDYSLITNDVNSPGQHGWALCNKCEGLFFGTNKNSSSCPADSGRHDDAGSADYAVCFGGSNYVVYTEGWPVLNVGGNTLWHSDQTTPHLAKLNGTQTATRLHVLPFSTGAGSITVEWLSELDTWVDFAYSGPEFGTFSLPFNTLAEGNTFVSYGGTLYFKSGISSATTTFNKRMVIRAFGGQVILGH
jgi:M6 family metalloprotease-like protein